MIFYRNEIQKMTGKVSPLKSACQVMTNGFGLEQGLVISGVAADCPAQGCLLPCVRKRSRSKPVSEAMVSTARPESLPLPGSLRCCASSDPRTCTLPMAERPEVCSWTGLAWASPGSHRFSGGVHRQPWPNESICGLQCCSHPARLLRASLLEVTEVAAAQLCIPVPVWNEYSPRTLVIYLPCPP